MPSRSSGEPFASSHATTWAAVLERSANAAVPVEVFPEPALERPEQLHERVVGALELVLDALQAQLDGLRVLLRARDLSMLDEVPDESHFTIPVSWKGECPSRSGGDDL